ncbi:MAG: gliding motility-associated C-terminal domain-containing protein [Bacteroidota bacterium]|nr:gliding motility-associated C-terminal domain-containing protein [Bacteroidota bacterium]
MNSESIFAQVSDPQFRTYRITAVKKNETAVVSHSNLLKVGPSLRVFIPSAFTPNKDGLNDFFQIRGEGIKSIELTITNRWGEIVYQSNNINEGWDGKYQGLTVQNDVYSWQLNAYGIAGYAEYKKGTLTVLH